MYYRPTYAEINLKNLEFNFKQIKKKISKKTKILAAVKANAYGHGSKEVAKRLVKIGVDYLGVACVDEALILRQEKQLKTVPILVLGAVLGKPEIKAALNADITLTVTDYKNARFIQKQACSLKQKAKVHIKIDTGMGRLGLWHTSAFNEVYKISKLKKLNLEGIYTHFPCADTDMLFTQRQLSSFAQLLRRLQQHGIIIPIVHAANSIAIFNLNQFKNLKRTKNNCLNFLNFLNMVRPGIMLYGLMPNTNPTLKRQLKIKIKPVLSLKTKITYLKDVTQGRSISYGATYRTQKKTKIATIPIGYADGYVRSLSNKSYVLIKGKFFPVVGRICMDQTMIDLKNSPKICLGDTVTLIGRQKKHSIGVEQLAAISQTIPYEITSLISSRVPRVFIK
ncbi:MAG: alanine racemase [Candidatus Omnitrophota bacterium]